MIKPEKQTKTCYRYADCRNYLQEKYGYDERDYASKYCPEDEEKPDLDFWHWVINNYPIHNSCYITFHVDKLPEIDDEWVQEIYTHYIEEFAEDGKLEMYIWW